MVEKEADIAAIEQDDGTYIYVPAVNILNERGEYSNCLGVMQPWLRPYAKVCICSLPHFDVPSKVLHFVVYRSLVCSRSSVREGQSWLFHRVAKQCEADWT
jgi:hypothetical protein